MTFWNFNNLTATSTNDLFSLMDIISEWGVNTTIHQLFLENGWNSYTDQEFVVFDTETLWFKDEIIEIWAIIVKNNMIKHKNGNFYPYEYYIENNQSKFYEMDCFPFFIKPTKDIPEQIVDLTHITMDLIDAWMSKNATFWNQTFSNFADAFNAFIDFVWTRPIVAHNAWFDTWIFKWSVNNFYSQLDEAIKDFNHPLNLDKIAQFFNLKVIDTYSMAQKALTLNPILDYKNGHLSEMFWLPPNEQMLHRAIYDVIFTARNFYWLYEYIWNTYQSLK